jgi:hypothetical protein
MATDLSQFPVPSDRFDVAQDNAAKLDSVVNGPNAVVTTRTGKGIQSIDKIIESIASVTDRGVWATATSYQVKDLVLDSGFYYIAINAHTSGATFAGDVANWRIYQGSVPQGDTRYGPIFTTAAAMVAASPVAADGIIANIAPGMTISTQGGVTAGDGLDAIYLVVAGDSSNGFDRLLLDSGDTAVVQTKVVDARLFGASTLLSNNSPNIIAAMAFLGGPGVVILPEGRLFCTGELPEPEGVVLEGQGLGGWILTIHGRIKLAAATELCFVGTGAKTNTKKWISSNADRGGVITNLSPRDANDSEYKLTSLTNVNGTERAFSAAIRTAKSGQACGLRRLRVFPNYNGIVGYNDTGSDLLSDEWDVGFWADTHSDVILDEVQIVGHWRIAGVLSTNGEESTSQNDFAFGERNTIRKSLINGQVGLCVRASDTWDIIAVGANSFDINDYDGNPWRANSTGTLKAGINEDTTTDFNVTSVVDNGATLTLNTTESTAGLNIGDVALVGSNFGMSQFHIQESEISGLDHSTGKRATELGFTQPSACLEVSGVALRGMRFINTKLTSHDDIAFFLNVAEDVHFDEGCTLESKKDATFSTFGIRAIATTNTTRMNMGSIPFASSVMDARPTGTGVKPARFNNGGDLGHFSPFSLVWSRMQIDYDASNTFLRPFNGGNVGFKKSDGTVVVSYNGGTDEFLVSPAGVPKLKIDAAWPRETDSIVFSRTFDTGNIADDDVFIIDLGQAASGQILFSSLNDFLGRGVYAFRASGTPYLANMVTVNLVGLSTGALTGTTGADAQFNLSVDVNGLIYVENRTGSTRRCLLTVCAGNV